MKLYSHPRSGTNFARAFLSKAFFGKCKYEEVWSGHWMDRIKVMEPARELKGGHHFWSKVVGMIQGKVYLVRDGRDVALSMYRTKGFQNPSWQKLSLGEFLRKPLDWYRTPGKRAEPGLTIVEHWKKHADSWSGKDNVCYIRYEELLTCPGDVIDRVAVFWDMEPVKRSVNVKSVGPLASDDHRIGKWKGKFGVEDLEYFHEIVPDGYWGLWGNSV